MDRMNQELARIRAAEMASRTLRKPVESELRDYRTDNGLMRIIRLGRR
jgi:hypothetical protein